MKYNLYFLQSIFLPDPYFVSIQTEMEINSDFSQNEQNHLAMGSSTTGTEKSYLQNQRNLFQQILQSEIFTNNSNSKESMKIQEKNSSDQNSIDIKIEDLSEDLTPQNQISLKFQEEIKIEIEPENELKSCSK